MFFSFEMLILVGRLDEINMLFDKNTIILYVSHV